MSRTTKIEWTEHTWNPFAGCSVHTAGCKNCYAMRQARRVEEFGIAKHYRGLTKVVNGKAAWSGKIARASNTGMRKPVGIKSPSMIFVNSMSDFFHEDADDLWRSEALGIMRKCPRHIFQILTKRPENIIPFLERTGESFPDNAWIGVTIEHEKTAHRADTLRTIPAKTRFISFEPLIGSVGEVNMSGIHWAIAGGESGPSARKCDPRWIREIRDQCVDQNVAYFFKQWGKPNNNPIYYENPPQVTGTQWVKTKDPVGKGGSLIDSTHWKQMPQQKIA